MWDTSTHIKLNIKKSLIYANLCISKTYENYDTFEFSFRKRKAIN